MAHADAVFAVVETLRKYDKPGGLSRNEIEDYMSNDYDVNFGREKFAQILKQITEFTEYDIVCTKGRYSRYRLMLKSALSAVELQLLCALIADTDAISRLEADQIIEKLCMTFHSSFESEEKIYELKETARSSKNEITGLDKLELLNSAIRDKAPVRFKIYDGQTFSDYITDTPLSWRVESGDLIFTFRNNVVRLSCIYNLGIAE